VKKAQQDQICQYIFINPIACFANSHSGCQHLQDQDLLHLFLHCMRKRAFQALLLLHFGYLKSSVAHMDLWGQVGHLNESQKQTLEIFKSAASEEKLNIAKFSVETIDQVACRFLRARQFDIGKAHELLHECWATKKEKKASEYTEAPVDETLKCEMTVLRKFYPHNQAGYDKYNRPLLFDNSGTINMNGISHLTTQEGLVGYHFWTMEKCLDELFTAGKERAKRAAARDNDGAEPPAEGSDGAGNCISTCVVLDLQGCSMATVANSAAMNHMKMLIALDNVVYPEMLGKMFVVNAPSFIVSTFAMVKGWLDVRTQKKIELLGSGPEMTARLLEFIDPDQLPVRYGGTATPDIYLAPDTCHPNCEYLSIQYNSMVSELSAVSAALF